MRMKLQRWVLLLVLGLCLTAAGCESTKKTIYDVDQWMKDVLW